MSPDECPHPEGAVIDWQQYKDEDYMTYRCKRCEHVVLARANGLEPKRVVNSAPAKQVTAYLMPDANVPGVL